LPQISAGILLYRIRPAGPEVLLIHPGVPYCARKDDGAWSIPKGQVNPGEDELAAAIREFSEETGAIPKGIPEDLGGFRQPGGKIVRAFALEGDFDPADLHSNLFALEWPPRSGTIREFPEADRAGWFDAETARRKALRGQIPLIDALLARLAG
jgi:predicted NUDIX family NTP pyrophosphohydrolase